jgi:5-methyltetrahydropteroyltriglutamate--homocysteine methyltransferase
VVYDGEQRRVEMYEHLMQKVENAVFLGRVKVWDAETYRKAAIIGVPRLKSSAYLEEFLFVRSKARREVKVPVTGPYTLMDWSYDEFYVTRQKRELGPLERRKRAREEMLYDLVENVVRPELRALVEAGARRIQIDEPALTTKPEEVELYVEAFNEMVKGIDATFTLHVCYSDYSKLFPHIAEMRVDEFSIECANRDSLLPGVSDDVRRGYSVLRLFREHSIGAKVVPGVTDVHTDFVEPPELVRDRLLYAARVLDDPEKVIACHDCGLRTRRWEVAFEKEKALVKGAELARLEFSGR